MNGGVRAMRSGGVTLLLSARSPRDCVSAGASCRHPSCSPVRLGSARSSALATPAAGLADTGAEIARRLGLEVLVFDHDAWRAQPLAEVPLTGGSLQCAQAVQGV